MSVDIKYKDLTLDVIRESLNAIFLEKPKERSTKIVTNSYGMDMFDEALQNEIVPSYRIYLGKKVARFIKNNIKIIKTKELKEC